MKACKARTKAGKPCQAPAGKSVYCFIHDPKRRTIGGCRGKGL